MNTGVPPSKNVPDAEDFFLNIPLYKSYTFNETDASSIGRIVEFSGTVDSYCIECKKSSTFARLLSSGSGSTHGHGSSRQPPEHTLLRERNKIYTIEFDCTRSPSKSHKLTFIILIHDGSIRKIGQYPSLADIENAKLADYRKELGPKGSELYKAVGLAAHGVGIGSFVYLRRIFEFLVHKKHDEMKSSLSIDTEDFSNRRMDEKIKLLKNYLPCFLVKHSQVYSILSKGVHELSDDECLEYFSVLKNSIVIILDEEISRKKREALVNETSAEINKLNTDIR